MGCHHGTSLIRREFAAKPLAHPYDGGLGAPEQYACFTCPAALVMHGRNIIAVTLDGGPEITLQYVDLVLPA